MSASRNVAAIDLVRSHSLTTLVQRELERQILSGELAPGTKLSEGEVAEQLSVSRGPVREAFRALEECGLVRLEKNRGVYVRQIPMEEADEIYELRAVLDDFVGRRVAALASAEDVRELRDHVTRMEKAATRKDVDAYLRANVEFHERLVTLAGNSKLLLMYRRLTNELRLFRRATLAQGDTLTISAREHRDIVDRIATGRAASAGRALYDHVRASQQRMHTLYGANETGAPPRPPRTAGAKRSARMHAGESEAELVTPEAAARR
ncbi:MAG: phosphonate utilization associated transcriptional regulator [Pseudomonadota bacterium]|nr:phosphonate utilization associated transcriptional regulator [Pseudomonadota bacterium]